MGTGNGVIRRFAVPTSPTYRGPTVFMYPHLINKIASYTSMNTEMFSATEDVAPEEYNEDIARYYEIISELQKVKHEVSDKSKRNHYLNKWVQELDNKIGLLVNHRISLEELTNICTKQKEMPESVRADQRHQLYSNLFYLLQTSPSYVATLTRAASLEEIDALLETVMFSLYGNQYEEREEHLLLAMFHLALTREIQNAQDLGTLMRNNSAMTRMMTTYTRRPPGKNYVKTFFAEQLEELATLEDSLEINSIKVLEELRHKRGEKQVRRGTQAEADADTEVQKIVQQRMKTLENHITRFLSTMYSSINRVPYGIRFLCKAIKNLVGERFPSITSDTTTIMVGGFFYLRFINPIITAPHAPSINILSKTPTINGRRALTLLAKTLQTISNLATTREAYMKSLEPFLFAKHDAIKEFIRNLCQVPDFHQQLEMEAFLALSKRQINLELRWKEISNIHQLLLTYHEKLVGEDPDKLSIILDELKARINPQDFIVNSETLIQLPLESYWPDSPENSIFSLDNAENAYKFSILLLSKIFKAVPHCLQEKDLESALMKARRSENDEVAALTEIAIKKIRPLFENEENSEEFRRKMFTDVKADIPTIEQLIEQNSEELIDLKYIYDDLISVEHSLTEKFDAYEQYLVQVRKAATPNTSLENSQSHMSSTKVHKFPFSQLYRDGVILDVSEVPEKRRNNLYFLLSVEDAGVFKIAVHYEGRDNEIASHSFGLEELLEHQYLQNPILSDLEFVNLNAKNLLLLIYRTFSMK
ncbi:hypothetical protein LOD99_60 [Oopsacas minuta]|uniref:Ras-GAP domain-containing protein n=1 Tax=Oopsacas minuta TaxID=111878 RepID=A0AAV7K8B4_9METZ|nr:hypothetical protein LOD99_60 [Oopsacas minuta]